MAPAIRGVAPPSNGIGPPVYANLAPAEPGDLLLVHTINDATNQTVAAPAGWTLVDGPNVSSTHTSYLFGRIADGSALDRWSGTWSGSGNWLATMVAVGDVARSSVAAAFAGHAAGNSASGTTHPTPTILTTQPNQLVLAFYSADASNGSHDWTSVQIGFSRLYEASEEIGHQSFSAFSGLGPLVPGLFSITENITSAEVGNEHIVALVAGPGSYDYAIARETQIHGLEMEDGNGDLRLEDDSGALLEEEPIGGLALEDGSGAFLLEDGSGYLRLELDQSAATDRLLTEDGLGVLIVESAAPWFQYYQLEDATGNIQLEDASGSLTSEGLLFYALDLETGTDRLLLETGEVLISEEPESLVASGAFALIGSVAAVAADVGGLTATVAMAGKEDGLEVQAGALTETVALAGSLAGTGATKASLAVASALAGPATATGAATASVAVSAALAGPAVAAAGDGGGLTEAVVIAGALGGVSGVTGSATFTLVLTGRSTGVSNAQGNLVEAIALGGNQVAVNLGSGALQEAVAFSASATFASTDSGNLTTGQPISGSWSGNSSLSATLVLAVGIAGQNAIGSGLSATVNVAVAVAGTEAGTARISASLINLYAGNVQALSRFNAVLSLGVALTGTSRQESTAAASLGSLVLLLIGVSRGLSVLQGQAFPRDISVLTGALFSAWQTAGPATRWAILSALLSAWSTGAPAARWSIIADEVSAWTEPPARAEDLV